MRYLLILLLCTVVLVSCQEEYVYPSVVTEFIDARTNGEGKLTWLITDQGDTLDIQNAPDWTGFVPTVFIVQLQFTNTWKKKLHRHIQW